MSDWKAATAPDGRQYYYNSVTKESTFTKPPGFGDDWRSATAPDGRTYYYNSVTKATTYEKPAGFGGAAPAATSGSWKEATAPDGRTYFYNTLTKASTFERPPGFGGVAAATASAGEWRAATAPDGRVYYYNTATKATTFDKPAGYGTSAGAGLPDPRGALPADEPEDAWTEDEFLQYMRFFEDADVDVDGLITPDELLALAAEAGKSMSRSEVIKLIAAKDRNGDGAVSVKEYLAFSGKPFPDDKEYFWMWLWNRYHSGDHITVDGVLSALRALDADGLTREQVVASAKKRVLSYADFKKFVYAYV